MYFSSHFGKGNYKKKRHSVISVHMLKWSYKYVFADIKVENCYSSESITEKS